MQASYKQLKPAADEAGRLAGDFIELGVYKGATFVPLAAHAHRLAKFCYGMKKGIIPGSEML